MKKELTKKNSRKSVSSLKVQMYGIEGGSNGGNCNCTAGC